MRNINDIEAELDFVDRLTELIQEIKEKTQDPVVYNVISKLESCLDEMNWSLIEEGEAYHKREATLERQRNALLVIELENFIKTATR